jgi:hypothetical protein
MQTISLHLDGGRAAPAVKVPPDANLTGLANALNLPTFNGGIAVVGGAASFDAPEYLTVRKQVFQLLYELSELAISNQIAVVDGGTPYGVMRLLGESNATFRQQFSLIGVVPSGKVAWNSAQGINWQQTWHIGVNIKKLMEDYEHLTPLDTNHSAFVLVEANEWGDEVEMLAAVAHELAGGRATVEVLINGGDVARRDVTAYLAKGGHVIVVEGTGRFADELGLAIRRGISPDPHVQAVLNTGRVHLFPVNDSPRLFKTKLAQLGKWA